MIIRPKNWDTFQHYKDRSPPWIKLHKCLLDDYEYQSLPLAAKAVAPMLWLLASEDEHGEIDAADGKLEFRLRIDSETLRPALRALLDAGFFCEVKPGERAEHAERVKSPAQQRREKHGFGSRHIPDTVKREVWERDQGKCCLCGSDQHIEYDHKIPVSKGGESTVKNVWLLCRSCNRSKRTKTLEQLATQAQEIKKLRSLETETEREAEAETEEETRSAAASPQTDGAKGKKKTKGKNQYSDEFEQAWKEYEPPRNASKFKAFRAWESTKRVRPSLEKMLDAIKGYNRWLKEESTKRKSTYPKQHMATWLNGRMWEGYLAQGSEADTKAQVEKSEKQWNGFARPFANIVGDGPFVAWFANTKVKEGKPNTLLVENEFRRTEIERRFEKELKQVLGKDVRIEVGK